MMASADHPGSGLPRPRAAAFRLTPDVKYLFVTGGHAAASAALREALDAGKPLIALCGAAGTGKTTLLTQLRSEARADTAIAYCPYPALSLAPMLQDFLGESDTATDANLDAESTAARLSAAHPGRPLVLIIDDATRSPPRLLVDLCRVADLLRKTGSTLQIILATNAMACQELNRNLAEAELPPASLIALEPIATADTGDYIRHRLAVAGLPADLFADAAVAEIVRQSSGIPRMINQICGRAIMLAEWRQEHPISATLVAEAVEDCPIDALVAAPTPRTPPAAEAPVQPSRGPSDEPAAVPQIAAEPAHAVDTESPVEEEIDLPPLPSQVRQEPDGAETPNGAGGPNEATPPRLPRRPGLRLSWQLREVVRERRLAQGDRLAIRPIGQRPPRYAGFVARKPAPVPGPKPASLPAPHAFRPIRAILVTAAALAAGTVAAVFLRPDLASRLAERLLTEQQLAQVAQDSRAALDRLLEFIRPAYHRERPPRS